MRATIGELIDQGIIVAHKDGNYGSLYPRTSDFGETGTIFLTAKNVGDDGWIDFASAQRLSDDKADNFKFGWIKNDDVLLSHNATVGRVAVVSSLEERALVGTSLTYFTLDTNRLLPRYFASFLRGRDFQAQLDAVMSYSTRNQVPITIQKQLSIDIPPLEQQKTIAHILGTLDDKIELNRKTNETLEAMAKALFKSWFVDFDPVRAKAEGRPTGLPAEISDLFPDSFEDSELGEIPSGWDVAEIAHIVNLKKDSIDPSFTPEETFDHYSIPAFDTGKNPAKELGSSIKSQKFLVDEGDLLVSKLNPSTPRVWIPFSSSERRSICSTEFLVCKASTDVGRAFAYCLASSDSIIEVMTGLAGGTSNSHQRIRPGDFLALDCCIGSQKVRTGFSDVVEPLLRKTLAQRIESRSLASARDALLPQLISGEIRIPDAEKMLEEVGV